MLTINSVDSDTSADSDTKQKMSVLLLLIDGTRVYAMKTNEGSIKVPCGEYDKSQHRTTFMPAIRDLFEKTGQLVPDGSYSHFERGATQVFYLHLDAGTAKSLRVGKPDNSGHTETLWVEWHDVPREELHPRTAQALDAVYGGA